MVIPSASISSWSPQLIKPPPVETPQPLGWIADHSVADQVGIANEGVQPEGKRFDTVTSLLLSGTIHLLVLLTMALWVKSSVSHQPIVMKMNSWEVDDEAFSLQVLESPDPDPIATLTDPREDSTAIKMQIFEQIPELEMPAPEVSVRPVSLSAGFGSEQELVKSTSGSKKKGVQFFGTHAYGNKFVYVLDISGSMSSGMGARMRRAQMELVRSINELEPEHSFYVVLYNASTIKMFGEQGQSQLRPATPHNKRQAARWIASIRPSGSTMPAGALKIAGDLKPDAVFFLSDGEFVYEGQSPVESAVDKFIRGFAQARPSALQRRPLDTASSPKYVLDRYAPEIVVHTIAFESENSRRMMAKIANEKGGEHRFIAAPQQMNAPRRRAAIR